MTLPAPLNLDNWFNNELTRYLSLLPTSNSPQPVHVLNGFFHHALEGQRTSKAAVDLVATKQGGGWGLAGDQLREKSPLNLPTGDYQLDQARRAIRALIAADGAVYKGFASFQLANFGLVTSDQTHFRIGDLAARLALSHSAGPHLLEGLIARLAERQPNPHWPIEHLLSEQKTLDGLTVATLTEANWWGTNSACAEFASNACDLMARALELSVKSRDSLLGLQVLATTATLLGLLTFAQVPGLLCGLSLAPLLCEAGEPGALQSVRSASADAFTAIDARFRDYLYVTLLDKVREIFRGVAPDGGDAVAFLEQCNLKKMSGGTDVTAQLKEIYTSWREGNPADVALARSLEDAMASAMGNKSRDWFAAVGRHCGLVGPRRGKVPRLRVEVTLVPALVLAGLDSSDGQAFPMSVWAERIASRFGLLFGASPAARAMSHRASEHELEVNQSELAVLLSSLGLARRYSDGVTEILNPLKVWSR